MNIAVNLLPFHDQPAGAGKYAFHVVHRVVALVDEHHFFLFLTEKALPYYRSLASRSNVTLVRCGFDNGSVVRRILWEQLVLPFQMARRRIDLLFTPSVVVPLLFNGRMVTSIHDVAYATNRTKYPFVRRKYIDVMTRWSARRSERVLTLTEFSRREICRHIGIGPEKVRVTFCGVDDRFFESAAPGEVRAFRERYALPDDFLLYVGAIEPGKNIHTVFEVFRGLCRTDDGRWTLVLTGGVGWKKAEVLGTIPAEVRHRIKILPYLAEEELPVLYQSAAVLVYISPYEGFGLPVLEAMASGIPAIASRGTSVEEFSSGVALLVDPADVAAVTGALQAVLKDVRTGTRLGDDGRARAKEYTWDRTSETVAEELRNCLRGHHEQR